MASHHIKLDPSPLATTTSLSVTLCNGKLVFFGGFTGSACLSTLSVFDLKTNEWLNPVLQNIEKSPGPRHQHCAEFIEPSFYLIFGGAQGPKFFNDTYLLNTTSFVWERVEKTGREPEPRYGATMCRGSGEVVYLMGGYGGSSEEQEQGLEDFWVFEPAKRQWKPLATFGEVKPKGTGWHSFYHLGLVWAVGEIPNKFLFLDLQSREWKERTAIGTHPAQLSKYSLTQLENNVIVVFGGVTYTDADNSTYVIDVTGEEIIWHKLDVTGNLPVPRHSHAACSLGETLLITGGMSARQYLSDICVINPSLELRWLCLRVTGTPPKARVLHTAVVAEEIGRMVVIGGDVQGRVSSEVHLFDYLNWTWKETQVEGDLPAVCGHSAVYLPEEQSVLVYGGGDLKECYSDIHILHLPSLTWRLKTVKRKIPPRAGHCAFLLPNNKEMAVVGGFVPREGYKNDVWIFNLQTTAWVQVPAKTNDVAMPVGRVSTSCSLAKNKEGQDVFWMIGGINQTVPLSDIWVMNLQTLTWDRMNPTGRGPGPVYGHSASLIKSTLFVYAPRCIDPSGAVLKVPTQGEVWSLHIAASPPYWSKYKVSNSIPPRVFHSAVLVTNDIVFFGGCVDTNVYQLDRNDIGDAAVSDNLYRDFIMPYRCLLADSVADSEEAKEDTRPKVSRKARRHRRKALDSAVTESPAEDEEDLYRKPDNSLDGTALSETSFSSAHPN